MRPPWWIAGGWALDLFLGYQTRGHGDLDVGVLRCDIVDVITDMSGWESSKPNRKHCIASSPASLPVPK
jgi:hypothetical protein